MDDARAAAASWWPHLDWAGALELAGAFHRVLVLPGSAVARMTKHRETHARLVVEHRALACVAAAGRWPVPAVLDEVRTTRGMSGMLTSWLPGDLRQEARWPEVAAEIEDLLRAAGTVLRATGELPAPRSWCGGEAFPRIVRDALAPLLSAEEGRAATGCVEVMLGGERGAAPVHGDLGMHNILWDTDGRITGLIDLDHACVGDPAIDVAPFVGQFGAAALAGCVEPPLLRRALVHRATLSLQVAASAHLVHDHALRDFALRNFATRSAAGTLHDPGGTRPEDY